MGIRKYSSMYHTPHQPNYSLVGYSVRDDILPLTDGSLPSEGLRPRVILRRKYQPTRCLADKQEATIMEAVHAEDQPGARGHVYLLIEFC